MIQWLEIDLVTFWPKTSQLQLIANVLTFHLNEVQPGG